MPKNIHRISVFAVGILATGLLLGQRSDVRSKSFKVGSQGRLEISVESGDLVIHTGSVTEVLVKGERLYDPDQNLQMWQRGDTVQVDYRTRSRWGARFEVTVPEQFSVNFETGGADVRVAGNLTGDLIGHTSGGNIAAKDVGGRTELKTSGGDIKVGFLQGPAEVHTSGGEILINGAGGLLELHTSGGDVTVRGDVGGSLDAKTSGGTIQVGNVGGEARMATAGGDIRAGIVSSNATLKTAGGDIELKAAFGSVRTNTAGGDIQLHEVTGSVNAKTAGGNIEALLNPEGEAGGEMTSSGGDLTLYLSAGARLTIEAHIEPSRGRRWGHHRDDREDRRWEPERYDIRSDFEAASYQRDDERNEVFAVYQINGGGPLMRLTTRDGHIDIRQAQGK